MGKFGGDYRGGWEKVACWSTKAAISLKRVTIEEKLLSRAYRNSPTLFRTVPIPSPTPYGLLFPKIVGSQPRPKTSIAIISGTGKESYGLQIWPVHSQGPSEQKLIKNFEEKAAWAYPGTAQSFKVPLISQERVKLRTNVKFCTHIHRINRNKSPLNISGKVAVGVVRDSRKFLGYPYIGRIAVQLCQFLVKTYPRKFETNTMSCTAHTTSQFYVFVLYVVPCKNKKAVLSQR